MENNKIISLEGITKHFPIGKDRFTALNGIDLSFNEGEFAYNIRTYRYVPDDED